MFIKLDSRNNSRYTRKRRGSFRYISDDRFAPRPVPDGTYITTEDDFALLTEDDMEILID